MIGGLQVYGLTTLDWVNSKNIMIPALGSNTVFDSYVLLQFDLVECRLQVITADGDVFAVPCTHISNVNRAAQIKVNFMEAETELQFLPDTPTS